MENHQQEQQQQGNESFVERFLAKFRFRNDNIEEKSVNDNEKKIIGNLEEMELELDQKKDEMSLNSSTKMGESSSEIVSQIISENEEVIALKNLKKQETNNSNINLLPLPRNNSLNDVEYLSKQLRGLINYLYDLPNLTFLTGGNYLRKQEERLKGDLEELEILYREIEATKLAISRLNKNKTAVRTEKRLVRNNLERLRSEAMSIMEKMVSTNEPQLFKRWETLRKSENIEELNNFLNEIKTKEMTAETMARLVRRRIFQVRAASIINDDGSQNLIQTPKPSKTKQPMATTVSTSPIGSQTGTKRSNVITNIRRKRISVNASGSSSISSGIRLRPMAGREKTTIQITPTNSVQSPNQRPSNNSMFVAVSNSSHSSISQFGPHLPPKARIVRPKPPIPPPPPIIRTRHIQPLFENDLLLNQNSNTSQSVSEASSSLFLTTSSTFQAEIKTVLKTLFGKEAADSILQEDEVMVNDTSINNNQVTIHNIEFEDLHHEENEEDNH